MCVWKWLEIPKPTKMSHTIIGTIKAKVEERHLKRSDENGDIEERYVCVSFVYIYMFAG